MSYLPRIADQTLQEHLEAFGAVLIEGPKWCGKTTTAEQQAKSELKLQNPGQRTEAVGNTHIFDVVNCKMINFAG